jgi:2-oxoglutarate dehydrogenase E2 component (dihydrolipoamide succinyltransferase)
MPLKWTKPLPNWNQIKLLLNYCRKSRYVKNYSQRRRYPCHWRGCLHIEGGGGAAAPAATPVTPAVADKVQRITAACTISRNNLCIGHTIACCCKNISRKRHRSTSVNGTGVDGRITKGDALNAQNAPAPAAKPAAALLQLLLCRTTRPASDRREKCRRCVKRLPRRLVAVKNETAMLTTFNEVDMQPIMELRGKYKDKFKEKHGVGLGFMSFFTKAVTEALKEWPAVGARIEGEEVVYSNFADISIAVSAPKGLVVPVIRNAESMSLAEIEKAIVVLAGKARESKLTIEEMTGGTFTITNGGVFGSMMSTPIINSPQSAILGMHNIIERPVAVNGQVVIRPMMYLALSYDHRIIDGRESVSFLVRVKQLLEDPARLLLGV